LGENELTKIGRETMTETDVDNDIGADNKSDIEN